MQKLKQKFSFLDDTEAFLMMNENSENLALIDYDKDGFQDIVMPTVDKNGNSRLNIFKYNAELQQFMPQLLHVLPHRHATHPQFGGEGAA